MRIAFFVHRYWPVVGGVEIYMQRLARALISMGHTVDVVTSASREDLPERDSHEGVSIYRFPALRSALRCRLWIVRNIGLFRRADVVHVSNTHMLEYFWRMVGPLVDRRKVFLTRHGMSYIHPVPEWEKRRAVRSLRLASGVVHDGAFIEKWLGVKPDICPDQGLWPAADTLTPVPEPGPDRAVYVGRLEPDSGIRMYLEAVRILTKARGRVFRLDAYGDGSLAVELAERAEREGLAVTFHGRVANAQNRITDGCFAFIDGRMAMQEAMARRRLVLAAFTDPLKEDYVGTEPFSSYLVAAGTGADLAERVIHFMDHPEQRRALVDRAFAHARTLTWERTAESYVGLWECGLARGTRPCRARAFLGEVVRLNREVGRAKEGWALGEAT